MQADHHDLHALLQLVLELYYKDERYFTPTISWSNEHKLAAFGEYQFHENHIYISRLLNTDQISKEAIMSVIYHELLHQDGTEHGQAFDRMTEQFPNYGTLSQELEEYFGTIDVVPPLNPD
jgi:predicted SprT family Zn-dependent metalloprotease